MKKVMLSLAAAPLILGSMAVSASAADGYNVMDGLKFKGEIRPRWEYADVDGNKNGAGKEVDAANAFTARTTLGVQADKLFTDMFGAYIELSSVNNFGYTDYAPENPDYDKILDPQQARVTQAYVDTKLGSAGLLRIGRQDVNIDDQRFIGTVNWRQMKQTYDAAAYVGSAGGFSWLAAYVYGFIGVGAQSVATDTGSVLLHADYKLAEWMKITGYGYLLASIHDTYGIALTGKIPAGDSIKLDYRAEYAMQVDPTLEYQVKDVKADAQYYHLDLGANISGILAGAGYESLGSNTDNDVNKGFTTPLATLHKWQGWADVFLGRTKGGNKDGLQDLNLRLGYKAKGFGKLLGVYHMFSAIEGDKTDLGTEIDALYANKVPGVNNMNFLVKAAFYSHGDEGIGADYDVTKGWLQLDYKFASK